MRVLNVIRLQLLSVFSKIDENVSLFINLLITVEYDITADENGDTLLKINEYL